MASIVRYEQIFLRWRLPASRFEPLSANCRRPGIKDRYSDQTRTEIALKTLDTIGLPFL